MDATLSSAPAQHEPHPPFDQPVRTLTVAADGGLSNMLRVLIFGLALAEATGRQFTMWWPRSPDCGATFHELFEDNEHQLNVIEVDLQQVRDLPLFGGRGQPPMFDILTAEEPHVTLRSWSWFAPHHYPAQRPLWKRAGEWLEALTPVAEIRSQVEDFRQVHFRPKMIGVHLRRGDFHTIFPEAFHNTRKAMAEVDAYLREVPDAGILLCTDDGAKHPGTMILTPKENVGEKFRQRYGDRVVMTTPRSLARDCQAVQDALVDMLLLRSADYVVSTSGSSFSAMIHLGRPMPYVNVTTNSLQRSADYVVSTSGSSFSEMAYAHFGQPVPHIKVAANSLWETVEANTPRQAKVVVISNGDDDLLKLNERQGRHFPQDDQGEYTRYYPVDSVAVIAHLEALRAKGADYLVLPSTALWWLEHYDEFRQHLMQHYRAVVQQEDTCLIFDLRAPDEFDDQKRSVEQQREHSDR